MNLTTENKQIDLLFPILASKCCCLPRESMNEKCLKDMAKFPYCVCTQVLPCRILIHQLKLNVASEEQALNNF